MATIFIAYIVVEAIFVNAADDVGCTFPSNSIACKVWNYTNTDCSGRELVCIPPLRHKPSLESLDLSHNELTALSAHSFCGLMKLRTLDLSYNNISAINGDTFRGLNLLQTLDMSHNSLQSLPDDVFSGFLILKNLYLNYNSDFSVAYKYSLDWTNFKLLTYLIPSSILHMMNFYFKICIRCGHYHLLCISHLYWVLQYLPDSTKHWSSCISLLAIWTHTLLLFSYHHCGT